MHQESATVDRPRSTLNFNGESGLDAAARGFQAWPRRAEPVWHSGLAHQQPSLAALNGDAGEPPFLSSYLLAYKGS